MPTNRRRANHSKSKRRNRPALAAVVTDAQPVASARAEPVSKRRRHAALTVGGFVAVFAAAFAATSLAGAVWWTMAAALTVGSVLLWSRVRRHTGMLTATAAVGVAWAVVAVASAQLATVCPGRVSWADQSSCTAAEAGTNALIGLLTPVSVFAVATPAIAVFIAGRWLWRRFRQPGKADV